MSRQILKGDYVLWVITVFLCAVSVAVVYSSTAAMSSGYTQNLITQFVIVGSGLLIVWYMSYRVNPSWIIERARGLVWFFLFLSFIVHIPHIGIEINGARRWLPIPFTPITFCPFDFLRVSILVDLSAQLSKRKEKINRMMICPDYWRMGSKSWATTKDIFRSETLPIFGPTFLGLFTIFVSNASTAILMFAMVIIVLWLGNVRGREIRKIFLTLLMPGIIFGAILMTFEIGRGETWKKRLIAIWDSSPKTEQVVNADFRSADDITRQLNTMPQSQYQKEMAKIAVASGGFFGKGPGHSTLRSQLPHSYDDCVYAFIIEEYGLFGGLVVMLAYVCILLRGRKIARRSKYYAFGVLSMAIVIHIFITALLNMMVSAGVIVTGQTLPFISKGGSAIWANSFAMGILLAISATEPRDKEEKCALP